MLPVGYVWDGPSYMSWIEWLIGNRNEESALAASAMHDTAYSIPTRVKGDDGKLRHTEYNIREGAKLYGEMLHDWPDRKEKLKKWQINIQRAGLVVLQPISALFSSGNTWEKVI